jgi:hypothetical protein
MPGEWHVLANLIPLGSLLAAATCFHATGVLLADSAAERGNRGDLSLLPNPSRGRSRRVVALLVTAMLVLGVGFILVCVTWDVFRPAVAALALALYILLAERVAFPRPMALGIICFLTVLLGTTTSRFYVPGYLQAYYFIALVVGINQAGVCWFSHSEVPQSPRWRLLGAASMLLAAGGLALLLPAVRRVLSHGLFYKYQIEPQGTPVDGLEIALYPYLALFWSAILAIPVYRAVREPIPDRVQTAGTVGCLGHIGLDALLAFGVVGWPGLLILVLLIPSWIVFRLGGTP